MTGAYWRGAINACRDSRIACVWPEGETPSSSEFESPTLSLPQGSDPRRRKAIVIWSSRKLKRGIAYNLAAGVTLLLPVDLLHIPGNGLHRGYLYSPESETFRLC